MNDQKIIEVAKIIKGLENELQIIGRILDSYADRETLDQYDAGVCAAYNACQSSLYAMLRKATSRAGE